MLTTWNQVRRSWVLSPDGTPLGQVRDIVVNPKTGDIPALWIRATDGMKLLAISEIKRWTRTEVFIDSSTNLVFPEEFPRIEEVLKHEIQIIKAPVFEKINKHVKIGECQNLSFDTLSPRLISIEVTKGAFLWKQSRVIHRRQILKIKSNGIFVSAPIVVEKVKEQNPTKILRKSIPEPEASQSFRHE
jgi:sporulation protein YlmC with PRC-barrel domain